MAKHLSKDHRIPLSKLVRDFKDVDLNMENSKKSYVWKFFQPKKGASGDRITSAQCLLCAMLVPQLSNQSTWGMRGHLQSCHKINLPPPIKWKKVNEAKRKVVKANPKETKGHQSREQRMVSKCFVSRGVAGQNDSLQIAECQLCQHKIHFEEESDISEMMEHLMDEHEVNAAKIKINHEEEEMMKEKIKKHRLISVVWRFFVLKDGKDGDRLAMCTLCGSHLILPTCSSTAALRRHLRHSHNMAVPSTLVVDNDKGRSLVSFLGDL